jgi:hypothetical protein
MVKQLLYVNGQIALIIEYLMLGKLSMRLLNLLVQHLDILWVFRGFTLEYLAILAIFLQESQDVVNEVDISFCLFDHIS